MVVKLGRADYHSMWHVNSSGGAWLSLCAWERVAWLSPVCQTTRTGTRHSICYAVLRASSALTSSALTTRAWHDSLGPVVHRPYHQRPSAAIKSCLIATSNMYTYSRFFTTHFCRNVRTWTMPRAWQRCLQSSRAGSFSTTRRSWRNSLRTSM